MQATEENSRLRREAEGKMDQEDRNSQLGTAPATQVKRRRRPASSSLQETSGTKGSQMKKNLEGRGLEASAVRREERPRGRDLEEKDTAIISFKAESH